MHITKTLAMAASIVALGTASMAGGLSDEIMEAPVEIVDEMAPATSSMSPTIIIVGILATLLLVSAFPDDDDDDEDDGGGGGVAVGAE